jgi:hypothetical protein
LIDTETTMSIRIWTLVFTLVLAVCSGAPAQPAEEAGKGQIAEIVARLGSSSYAIREKAYKEIEALGPTAIDALRGAKRSTDAEANRRIDALIHRCEEQILTKQILAPKEIHVKLNEIPVQQAIAEVAKLSGYAILFQGDALPFASKKITLDTGKTTFWQALDQLCEKAGLMEQVDLRAIRQDAPDATPIGKRRMIYYPPPPTPTIGPIVLVARGNEKSIVSYAGAVKTELRISKVNGKAKELDLLFVVSAEPRYVSNTVVGRPMLQKILDGASQKLGEVAETGAASAWQGTEDQPYRRFTGIRVKAGEQAAKQLKEVAGKLTFQVELKNETLARIDKVLESAGKSADGANGGSLKVLSLKKHDNGNIEMQLALENLTPNPFGGNVVVNGGGGVVIRGNINGRIVINGNGIQMNGNGNQADLPDLVDAKGQKFKVGGVTSDSINFVNGSTSRTVTIVYQRNVDQAEPRELVLLGVRAHTIAVPFRFENVPLP